MGAAPGISSPLRSKLRDPITRSRPVSLLPTHQATRSMQEATLSSSLQCRSPRAYWKGLSHRPLTSASAFGHRLLRFGVEAPRLHRPGTTISYDRRRRPPGAVALCTPGVRLVTRQCFSTRHTALSASSKSHPALESVAASAPPSWPPRA